MGHVGIVLACLLLMTTVTARAAETSANLVENPGFEADAAGGLPPGWSSFWSRTAGDGEASIDANTRRDGARSLKVVHRGGRDWSVGQVAPVPVNPGEILTIGGWIKADPASSAQLSVVTRDAAGKTVEWLFGRIETSGPHDWREFKRRIVIPSGVATVQYRFTGWGETTVWLDDASLTRDGTVEAVAGALEHKVLNLKTDHLDVHFDTATGCLAVTDRRNGRAWEQHPASGEVIVKDASVKDGAIHATLWDVGSDLDVRAMIQPAADAPDVTVTLDAKGGFPHGSPLRFPHPFVTAAGTSLAVPLNEGILYPVDDASIEPTALIAYGGHGISMPWYGAFDPQSGAGVMTILNTPDDARIRLARQPASAGVNDSSTLFIAPEWEPTRATFGYPRSLTYVFHDAGGYVAQAKRYRAHAQRAGLVKTLAEKRKANDHVDALVGAANIWNWDAKDPAALCREMKDAGLTHVLWSRGTTREQIEQIHSLGYLAGRYDIYQDVMDPAQFPKLRYTHPDWPTEAWPKDLMRGPTGDWVRGWEIELKEGEGMIPCGTLCDRQALPYARQRIGEELKTKPYRARFIDTTTASPWRECYDPDHPMSRTESREWKMKLLELVSKEFNLVTGTETGIDPSVPFVHYYEGMLSLGPYRLPDAGRDMQTWREPTSEILKFQVGHKYRAPLWELVYHDCVVSQWYWGDYNNKIPDVWRRRDLFNILYGTPPMYMFTKQQWDEHKPRFVASAREVCGVARRVGYDEMRSHEFVTPDGAVQRTRWSSGETITVNFGDAPYRDANGQTIAPLGWRSMR